MTNPPNPPIFTPYRVNHNGFVVMTSLTEFLFPAPAPRSARGILRWWEGRRLGYNLIVGAAGVFSYFVTNLILWIPPHPYPPEGVPIVLPIVFGVGANICYTLGSIAEYAIHRLWGNKVFPVGPTLYRMGLTFSVGLALMPILIAKFGWLARIFTSIF